MVRLLVFMKVLIISNGHGEDLSGSLLGKGLISRGHKVDALSLVGKGRPYKKEGIKNYGLNRDFSTGGIGYTSLIGRLTELFQGQLLYLFSSIFRLFFIANRYDLFLIVGDVIPIFAAWLLGKPSVVYLVAYSSHYEGKLRLPWPSKFCLSSPTFREIYSRDQLTADDLTDQLRKTIKFLGNPFMDPVFGCQKNLPKIPFRLGILPGSRRPELDNNLELILRLIPFLSKEIFTSNNVSFDIALVDSLSKDELSLLLLKYGWEIEKSSTKSDLLQIFKSGYSVNIHWHSFAPILQSSNILLAMAGTAAEQAIGLSKPVVQLPGRGPQFTPSFAEAQRRLLGPTIFCASRKFGNKRNFYHQTANLILDLYQRKDDLELKRQCSEQAILRLGTGGGTERIVDSIVNKFIK